MYHSCSYLKSNIRFCPPAYPCRSIQLFTNLLKTKINSSFMQNWRLLNAFNQAAWAHSSKSLSLNLPEWNKGLNQIIPNSPLFIIASFKMLHWCFLLFPLSLPPFASIVCIHATVFVMVLFYSVIVSYCKKYLLMFLYFWIYHEKW